MGALCLHALDEKSTTGAGAARSVLLEWCTPLQAQVQRVLRVSDAEHRHVHGVHVARLECCLGLDRHIHDGDVKRLEQDLCHV